jgi:hypothetical protein
MRGLLVNAAAEMVALQSMRHSAAGMDLTEDLAGSLKHMTLKRMASSGMLHRVVQVPLNRWFLQEPHGITSQKTAFFMVTTVKTSNLTYDS